MTSKRTLSGHELKCRWSISDRDLTAIVMEGDLTAYDPDTDEPIDIREQKLLREMRKNDPLQFYLIDWIGEEGKYGVFFYVNDVEAFERNHPKIINLQALLPPQNNDDSVSREEPEKINISADGVDKALEDLIRKATPEVEKIYNAIKKAGLQQDAKDLKKAAAKEFESNKLSFQYIKQGHFNTKGLFAFSERQERRDFIGTLLKLIATDAGLKTPNRQKLFDIFKKLRQS